MNATVVCISRTLAAGGAKVGHLVAERLNYRYFDEEIITLAGEKAQVDPRQIGAIEHHEGLISRVMDSLATVAVRPHVSSGSKDANAQPRPHARAQPPAREEARRLIREVIMQIAEQGNAVIVAHAASIPLAGKHGVLRVLITAPERLRAQRLEFEVGVVGERDALRTIQESDRARLAYLRDFYKIDDETTTLYDLVINTEKLAHETAADIIVSAARRGANS